jgi:GT2 family glycosyltransferase
MITASIVIYNSPEKDLQTIISCVANSVVSKIYVIDNASNDILKKYFENLSGKVVYIQGQGNIGYGAAHNIAMREVIRQDVTYHLVVNPDISFREGTIEKIAEFMDTNPGVGQLIPKVLYPNGELQYVCNLIPTPLDLLFRRFMPSKIYEKRARKFQLRFTGYNKIMNVPYHHGCFMFFRVTALKEIGLFDERFFMYPEDIDLTRRMHEKYATLFYPEVEIVHTHAAESRKNLKMLRIHIINLIRYFNKWGWFFDAKRRKANQNVMKKLQ